MDSKDKIITSPANPAVKQLRSLNLKKYRDEQKLFLVEGARHIGEALENGWEADMLVFSSRANQDAAAQSIIQDCKQRRIHVLETTDQLLGKITQRDNTQPIIGVFKQRLHDIGIIKRPAKDLWLGLENIRDPGNLGTIIRTADAAGAKGIILIGNTCDPWSPEVVRATMGSFAHMPMIRIMQEDFIRWRKNYAGRVIGTHLNAKSADYRSIKTDLPLLLLMGGEQSGLSEEICAACDTLAKIPMTGKTESLNLAVSAGIMLYEIVRSRI